MPVLTRLLTPRPLAGFSDFAAFRSALAAEAAPLGQLTPVDRALLGGHLADRLGYAFAAGYGAALARLVPDVAEPACLCVTEEGGAHPRAVHTRLEPRGDGFVLTGRKQWATLADAGQVLLVAASTGFEGDHNRLVVVRVRQGAPGLVLTAMGQTPFAPEIGHFHVRFDGVAVAAADVLPGDGYLRYVKPFRTVEDIHVSAAAVAYLLAVGMRSGWAQEPVEGLVAVALGLRALAGEDPDEPATHVALGGVLGQMDAVVGELGGAWALADAGERHRWERDAPLLRVAGGARKARRLAAWGRLPGRGGDAAG